MANAMRSEKGTTTVEFALVSILLFTLMFGIFEGGRVFNGWLVITNEAREAARWGAVRVGDPAYSNLSVLSADVRNHIVNRTASVLNQDPAVFNASAIATDRAVTVTISYTVQIMTPLISNLWPDFNLAAQSTMRAE